MKKNKLFLTAICTVCLFACSNSTTSSQQATSSVTTSSVATSSISSVSNVKTTAEPSDFQKQLKKTLDVLDTKSAIGANVTDASLDVSLDTTKTVNQLNRKDEIVSTDSQQAKADVKASDMKFTGAIKGMKGTQTSDLSASTDFTAHLDTVSYTDFGETEADVNITNKDTAGSFYLENNVAYADLNDQSFRDFFSTILDLANIDSITLDDVPEYASCSNIFEKADITMPMDIFSFDFVNTFLDEFVDEYDALPSAFQQALTFQKDNDYYYADITVTKLILSSLPLAYQTYATSKLDMTSETYSEDLQNIKDSVIVMNKIVAKMTLNNFNIQMAINDTGIAFFSCDIDFKIKGYLVSDETEEETLEETSYTIDELDFKVAAKANFDYDDAVKVETHGDHEYENYDIPWDDIEDAVDDLPIDLD